MSKRAHSIVSLFSIFLAFPLLAHAVDQLRPLQQVSPVFPKAQVSPLVKPDAVRIKISSPVLIEPVNKNVPLGSGVVCSWQPFLNATRYSVKVSTKADMSDSVSGSPFTSSQCYLVLTSQNVRLGGTYYWQVAALDASAAPVYGPTPPAYFSVGSPAELQGACDLAITAFSFSSPTIYQGDPLTMSLSYKNISTNPFNIPSCGVSMWVLKGGTFATGGGAIWGPATIAAGEQRSLPAENLSPSINLLPPGTYTMNATILPQSGNCAVNYVDLNTANNSAQAQLTILPKTLRGDLVISGLSLDTPTPTSTVPFKLNVTLKNQGQSAVWLYGNTALLACDPYGSFPIPWGNTTLLQPGATLAVSVKPNTAGSLPGTRTWAIRIDPYNYMIESDKTNNTKSITFTVK